MSSPKKSTITVPSSKSNNADKRSWHMQAFTFSTHGEDEAGCSHNTYDMELKIVKNTLRISVIAGSIYSRGPISEAWFLTCLIHIPFIPSNEPSDAPGNYSNESNDESIL
jgi:hypothetical protein